MEELLDTLAERIDPAHTAMLVVDMQNDFCAPGGYIDAVMGRDVSGSAAVADAIAQLLRAARGAGVPAIWVRAAYDFAYLSAPMLAKIRAMGVEHAVCCAQGSWGADWFRIRPEDGEPEIVKHRYSAFVGTPLEAMLKRRGVRTVVITGVATNVCIDSTLRDAFLRDYYVVVPAECVGAADRTLHEATLRNVDFLFGDLTSGTEIAGLWAGAGAPA